MAEGYSTSHIYRDYMAEMHHSLVRDITTPSLPIETAATALGAKLAGLQTFNNPGLDSIKQLHDQMTAPLNIPSLAAGYQPLQVESLSQVFQQMQSNYQLTWPSPTDFISPIDTSSILERVYESWMPSQSWFDQINTGLSAATAGLRDLQSAAAATQLGNLVEEVSHHVPNEVREEFLTDLVEPVAVELADELMQSPPDSFLERFEAIVAQIDTDEAPDVSAYLDPTDIVSRVQHTNGFRIFSAQFSHLSENRIAYGVSICIITSVLATIMHFVPDDAQQVINNWIAIFGILTSIKPR